MIYKRYTPDIEIYSIDEAFLDVTTTHHFFNGPEAIGVSIKKEVKDQFGIIGETLRQMGQGRCDRPLLVKEEDPKSIGHSMTLPKDISDSEAIKSELLKLSSMVGRRARKYDFVGKKITLTIRYSDFKTFTKQATLPAHSNCTHEIYRNALDILDSIRLADKVRLLGVSLSRLMRDNDDQLGLFNDDAREKSMLKAVDSLNDKFGDFTVTWASYMKTIEPQSVISPVWRPSGVRNLNIKN